MLGEFTPPPTEPQFQRLADARRVLKVCDRIAKAPVLDADERAEINSIRAYAVRYIGVAVEELVETLDVLQGDVDLEDATGAEDSFEVHQVRRHGNYGPGCLVSDDDSAVDDMNCDDINIDLEPDTDAEVKTWAHSDDHPAELFVGRRQGGDEPPEAA